MVRNGRASHRLIEGHERYCRGCGHDLVGLSGERCPRCSRTLPFLAPPRREDGASGKRLVIGLVACGLILAIVGLKYRRFEPAPANPAAGTTHPASTEPASSATAPARNGVGEGRARAAGPAH